MLHNYSDEHLCLAARLYYVDGLPQTEVARFANVSQAQVSRLLAAARERGIVKITVADYAPRRADLERELLRRFELKTVAVIKTAAGLPPEDARRAVAHFGAPFIASLLPSKSVVAISGGRTLRELVEALPRGGLQDLTVVQAMGSIDSTVGPVDALELARSLTRNSGGSFLALNSPAFVPDRRTRDAFLNLDQIKAVWQQFRRADVALVGVGSLENSVFVERGVLSTADLATLRENGAAGEICGRFFDNKGREVDSPWRDRVISIGFEQLRRIPQVVGVVAGADRAGALAAAVRGGLLKSLLVDESAAGALLDSAPSSRSSRSTRKSRL